METRDQGLDRIDSFLSLESGWVGYSSRPITRDTVERAKNIYLKMLSYIPHIDIFPNPCSSGEITFDIEPRPKIDKDPLWLIIDVHQDELTFTMKVPIIDEIIGGGNIAENYLLDQICKDYGEFRECLL